ncbi:MAG TPA: hypothetical protein VJ654_05640 [Noviherbaspirillum sp.]|nr:hypothetical protein [Noviherbaspirillum sp.]
MKSWQRIQKKENLMPHRTKITLCSMVIVSRIFNGAAQHILTTLLVVSLELLLAPLLAFSVAL